MKTRSISFLLGLLVIFAFSNAKSDHKSPTTTLWPGTLILMNESTTTTVSKIEVADNGVVVHTFNNVPPGKIDTVYGLGIDVLVNYRVGNPNPAGRIKLWDNTGSLVSCTNTPANSNLGVSLDLNPMAACAPYRISYNNLTCPN